MPRFFVATQIGAETELEQELRSFWHLMLDLDGLPTRSIFPAEIEHFNGGLEFECDLHLGLQINFFTRLANRVLMRVSSFRARYFDQFEKELQKCPFKKWLQPQALIELQISHHKSRLNNERNLIESGTRALAALDFKSVEASQNAPNQVVSRQTALQQELSSASAAPQPQAIFIRIDSDQVSVSLDTTGAHLHFRGYRLEHGEAPIRETLAAQFLQRAMRILDEQKLSLPELIVDPFCGSGTLLIESILIGRLNSARDYSFLHWQNLPAMMQSKSFFQNYFWLRPPASAEVGKIDLGARSSTVRRIGIEKDPVTLRKAERNSKRAIEQYGLMTEFSFINGDCAEISLENYRLDTSLRSGLILTNPPYGERLAAATTLKDLVAFINKNSQLRWIVFMIVPQKMAVPNLGSLKLIHQSAFENQGLQLQLVGYS